MTTCDHKFTRAARFWAFINGGPVKLTIRPGDRLTHTEFQHTEEGFHEEFQGWDYDEDTGFIARETHTRSRDCDGRHGESWYDECRIDRVAAGEESFGGIVWPDWKKAADGHCYDEFAQNAGY